MKKFMFTALALIAFSGISNANTIAVEDTVENEISNLVKVDGNIFSCYIYAVEAAGYEPSSAPNPYTGGMEGYWDNVSYYMGACMDAEGTILMPVIIP